MEIKLNNLFFSAFFVLAGLGILIALFWLYKTESRLKRFFLGKKGADLEETIREMQNKITELEKSRARAETEIADLRAKLKKSIRGLETLRFNPFPDQGGNQSFAIGMLNEDGDGVVVSSLYARDRMSVFAKPIKNNKSEYELTDEEKKVLEKAKV